MNQIMNVKTIMNYEWEKRVENGEWRMENGE
jgi:hypothetical protein